MCVTCYLNIPNQKKKKKSPMESRIVRNDNNQTRGSDIFFNTITVLRRWDEVEQ